jgi:PadR family transcriptional regulator
MSPRGIGIATIAVMRAIADGSNYGFEIVDETGLPSGTVYPALSALERRGYATARWESDRQARSEARPRRRYYRLTAAGAKALEEALDRLNGMGLGSSVRTARVLRNAEGH